MPEPKYNEDFDLEMQETVLCEIALGLQYEDFVNQSFTESLSYAKELLDTVEMADDKLADTTYLACLDCVTYLVNCLFKLRDRFIE